MTPLLIVSCFASRCHVYLFLCYRYSYQPQTNKSLLNKGPV
jgi:hypothetical protein